MQDSADRQAIRRKLDELRAEVASLESQLTHTQPHAAWVPEGYYTTYHIVAGMTLGLIAAAVSLLLNIIGAVMVGEPPLKLIQVYLTFPLGEQALSLEGSQAGFILAAGCCLYLITGMFGGIPFHLILSRYFSDAKFSKRFLVASVLGLGVWLVNFYGVLCWVQPLLIGGNWIVDKVPTPVAIATHLVFGWTMLLVEQWGRFIPGAHKQKELGA